MKKVLFATTALVATAGVASADIALSGVAEMGVSDGTGAPLSFFTDIDVTFTMSGETDNGLTFGAAIDIDETAGPNNGAFANNADDGGIAIFLSGNFGTVTMGDTDGAFDWALTEVSAGNAGSIADDETAHAGYTGNAGLDGTYDGQIVRYDYAIAGFGVAISAEFDDNNVADPILGIGGRYSLDLAGFDIALGAGYQQGQNPAGTIDAQVYGVSASVGTGFGLTVTGNYSMGDTDTDGTDETRYGIGAGYTYDAYTVYANFGYVEEGATENTGYGVAAAYDLGGGASIHAGYGQDDNSSSWSFGVAMSF